MFVSLSFVLLGVPTYSSVTGVAAVGTIRGNSTPTSASARPAPPPPTGAHSLATTDVVLEWNALMQSTVAPLNPFFQARTAAIVQLAVFEAVNAILGDSEPYLETVAAPPGASPEAAAVAAAHRTLVTLRPLSAPTLDPLRANDGSGAVVPQYLWLK